MALTALNSWHTKQIDYSLRPEKVLKACPVTYRRVELLWTTVHRPTCQPVCRLQSSQGQEIHQVHRGQGKRS